MNASSANTLLKILEEPQGNRLFILITNNSSRLLSTILSRAIKIKLNTTTEQENNDEDIEQFIIWMRLCFTLNFAKLITFIDDIAKRSKDNIKMFFRACTMCLEEIVRIQCGVAERTEEQLVRLAAFIDNNKMSKLLTLLSEAEYKISRNVNIKIMMFNLSIDINKILKR